MDAQQLHLMLNYYPAIGTFIGVVFLLIGFWRRSDRIKQTSLKIFFVVALLALPTFVSGEISGAAAARIHTGPHAEALNQHKETARTAFLLLEATGLAALIGLFLFRRGSNLARWCVLAVLVLSLAACGLIAYTTHLGRQVKWAGVAINIEKPVYVEFRHDHYLGFQHKKGTEKKLWHA